MKCQVKLWMIPLDKMKVERFKHLYAQYLSQRLTTHEREEWMELLQDKALQQQLENTIPWFNTEPQQLTGLSEAKAETMVNQIVSLPQRKNTIFKTLWPRMAVAASIAFIMAIGAYFYSNSQGSKVKPGFAYAADIAPGKNKATLTLSDGRKIALSETVNGELAQEAGVVITKSAEGALIYGVKDNDLKVTDQINALSTGNGETYKVILPDGTLIWLNASSSIKYPASFEGIKQRVVELKGEAYFEVAKDKSHPFVVKSEGQEIEVLGTHFNVRAYPKEPLRTALAEGAVKVSTAFGEKLIAPGQQTVVTDNAIAVEAADLDETLAWKDGFFKFNSESIENIMTVISRWYAIDVVYQDRPKNNSFTGRVSRYRNISEVLKMLEQTKGVHFKIEGRRVTVMQ